jgi:hypothetical protein
MVPFFNGSISSKLNSWLDKALQRRSNEAKEKMLTMAPSSTGRAEKEQSHQMNTNLRVQIICVAQVVLLV